MLRSIRVQHDDFDAALESAKLTQGRTDIGAVVTFAGLCRDEGGKLEQIDEQRRVLPQIEIGAGGGAVERLPGGHGVRLSRRWTDWARGACQGQISMPY